MTKLRPYIIAMTALLLTTVGWAELDKSEQPLSLELDLVDGSHIIGVPSIESVSVQTPYAKVEISLNQILSITIDDDHQTATFDLRNGDKLAGALDLEPIELQTLFGKVLVDAAHMTKVRTVTGGISWRWEFDEGDVDDFTMSQTGAFTEENGSAVPSAYGSGEDWHGPKAAFPLTVQGNFHLDASINYQTEGRQLGQITLGVALESGTILSFAIVDSHTATVEHGLTFAHGDETVWTSGLKKSSKSFSDYPIVIERSGDLLRCLAGDRVVATHGSCDQSAVKQVFFTIKQYASYPALTEASIGRIALLRPNE